MLQSSSTENEAHISAQSQDKASDRKSNLSLEIANLELIAEQILTDLNKQESLGKQKVAIPVEKSEKVLLL